MRKEIGMADARETLVDAIKGREPEATLHGMALALAPRKPAEQVIALIEIENDMGPQYADLKAKAKALAAEIAKLDTVKNALRDIITHTMEARSLKKVDAGYCTISLVAGRESMVVTDLDAVPDDLSRMEKVADKKAALAYITQSGGVVPPGFEFKRGDPYLTVRAKKRVG